MPLCRGNRSHRRQQTCYATCWAQAVLRRVASLKAEKAHIGAVQKGCGEPLKGSNIAPPSVEPPEALYDTSLQHKPK